MLRFFRGRWERIWVTFESDISLPARQILLRVLGRGEKVEEGVRRLPERERVVRWGKGERRGRRRRRPDGVRPLKPRSRVRIEGEVREISRQTVGGRGCWRWREGGVVSFEKVKQE